MGASNVIAAYSLYAGRVPATSMQVLAYMAVVSKDSDDEPWYGQGHMALAQHALGRSVEPCGCVDACRHFRSHEEAVRRAVRALRDVGAVTVNRAPSRRRSDGPRTVRYRLHLVEPASVQRPTESVSNAPRKTWQRPTENVSAPHGFRGAEEEEDYEERVEEERVGFSTQVQTAREGHEPNPNFSVKCLHGLPADIRADGEPSCALCRRAAREAS